MNINEAKDYIFAIARKNQIGNIPIAQLNLYFERAQLDVIADLRQDYQKSSIVTDSLTQIVATKELYNQGDKFFFPDDYYDWIDLFSFAYTNANACGVSPTQEWVPIELIPVSKLSYRGKSTIVKAETLFPVAVEYDAYYYVLPPPPKVQLTYLRVPASPKWAYTLVNNFPIYDPINSQDFELFESTHNQICFKVLNYMGIATRDADLYQTTSEK